MNEWMENGLWAEVRKMTIREIFTGVTIAALILVAMMIVGLFGLAMVQSTQLSSYQYAAIVEYFSE